MSSYVFYSEHLLLLFRHSLLLLVLMLVRLDHENEDVRLRFFSLFGDRIEKDRTKEGGSGTLQIWPSAKQSLKRPLTSCCLSPCLNESSAENLGSDQNDLC